MTGYEVVSKLYLANDKSVATERRLVEKTRKKLRLPKAPAGKRWALTSSCTHRSEFGHVVRVVAELIDDIDLG